MCDTGAALCCAPTSTVNTFGIRESNLFKSSLNLFAADRRKLYITGSIPVTVSMRRSDRAMSSTKDILYFVVNLKRTFISKDALIELNIIPSSFPAAQPSSDIVALMPQQQSRTRKESLKRENTQADRMTAKCGCQLRTPATEVPALYLTVELKSILLEH